MKVRSKREKGKGRKVERHLEKLNSDTNGDKLKKETDRARSRIAASVCRRKLTLQQRILFT